MKLTVYWIILLLCSSRCIVEAQSNFVSLSSSCNNTDGTKVTAASISSNGFCGVRFYSQNPFFGSSSSLYLGFAVNFAMPPSAKLRVVVPTSSAYQLNAGGTSSVVGLTTSGGDVADVALHGTGTPSLVAVEGGFEILMGTNRTATVLDSKSGFEMLITNMRNPYKNVGDGAAVSMLYANGTEIFTVSVPLIEFSSYTLTDTNVSISLSNNDAMVVSDVSVELSTSGYLPSDGKMEIHFPAGFKVQKGVTEALNQNKFAVGQAIFVSDVDEASKVVSLQVAPNLGYINTGLSALQSASFQLTRIRNPFAGTTSTFMIRTMTGDGSLIDAGNISGTFVKGGALTCKVASGSDLARQLATYDFEIRTVGTIPRDGKFVIVFPFGFYLLNPRVVASSGFGVDHLPRLETFSDRIHICLDNLNLTSDLLGNLGTFTFKVAGIVNPGAGSTNAFNIRTTFFDPTRVIDDSSVPGVSITTSVFPTRSISYSNVFSGQQNLITVNFSTVGYVPTNAIVHIGMPDGFGVSLPTASYVASSTCCDSLRCFDCNITLYRVDGQELFLRLFGTGQDNLPEGLNISFTIANVRNLWAGTKNGIDISLLLSDETSIISQAIDVDSIIILPGSFRPSLLLTFLRGSTGTILDPPAAGVCGFYRVQLNVSGTLPPRSVVEITFPPLLQVNDLDCSSPASSPASVSQVRAIRPAHMGLLSSDAGSRRVVFQILEDTWSDSWAQPNMLEFDILNLRHTAEGQLGYFSIVAYREDGTSVVEQNLSVPGRLVTANSFTVAITPSDASAGVRSQLTLSFSSPAVLPAYLLLQLQLPGSFLMDDGDLTQILSPTVGGAASSLSIQSKSVGNGTISILVQGQSGLVDGVAASSCTCSSAGQNCVRNPSTFPSGLLIVAGTQISFILSNIRNLAGGFSGLFAMVARASAQSAAISKKMDISGPILVVGQLKDAQVTLQDLGSSMTTKANVTIVIFNTFALEGSIKVVLPPGFKINAGGATSVSSPSITRLSLTYPTTAVLLSSNELAREVEVQLSSAGIQFLSSSDTVQFFLSHIQNSVARQAAGGQGGYIVSDPFLALTLLRSGELVETRNASGSQIVPNPISSFPAGAGRVFPESLVPGYRGLLFLEFSLNVDLPAGAVIELSLPSSFDLTGTQISLGAAGYREANMAYQLAISGGLTTLSVSRRSDGEIVSSGEVIRLNMSSVQSPTSTGLTGEANLRVLTSDGGVLAVGVLPPNNIGHPSEPRNVLVKNCEVDYPQTNPFCLRISFDKPLDDGGSPIVSYKVLVVDNAPVETIILPTTGQDGPFSITTRSLSKNTFFTSVQAANGLNDSSYGIEGKGNSLRIIDLPGPPRPGLLRPGSANVISASWLPPQYTGEVNPVAKLLGYKIEFDKTSSSFLQVRPNDTLVLDASQTSASSRFLSTGFYYARIFARNDIGYGPPAVFATTALATPFLPVQWTDNATDSSSSSFILYVDGPFQKPLQAFDGDITDQVSILVDDAIGLPDGFELLPPVVSGRDGGSANVVTRTLSILPTSSQTGRAFQVCLLALNSNANPLGPNIRIRRCLSFSVLHPQLRWTADTPEEGSSLLAYPGCNVEVLVNAISLWYSVQFRYTKLLMGFDGVFSSWNGTLTGVSFAPTSSSPVVPQLGPQPEFQHSARFFYQPPPSLAGRKLKLCFLASDSWNISSISRCVILQLGSCKACIRAGQTLSSLALEYRTDWLQLWLTNPTIGNPKRIRSAIDILSIGVPFTTRGGETVSSLAERFYMTPADVLNSNADFVSRIGSYASALTYVFLPNYTLCIIPPVCKLRCLDGGACSSRPDSLNPGFVS